MQKGEVFTNFVRGILDEIYKNNQILKDGEIAAEIEKWRDEYSQTEHLRKFVQDLTQEDFDDIKKDLESLYNIEYHSGQTLSASPTRQRDKQWWSERVKLQKENYYFERFNKHLSKDYIFQARSKFGENADAIMNQLGEVGTNEGDTCGLIVSSVQSGKTLNYSALICKAADAGYKFFVILTTDHNNLRTQTQRRIEEYFVGKKAASPSALAGSKTRATNSQFA